MNDWFPGPSVAEERADAVRRLLPEIKVETPWRHYGMLLRIVFTVAAAIAVSAMFNLFRLLFLPKGWFTAALAIGLAEWLIRKHRFFRTGIESGLWICGTFAFIFGLPSSGKVEAILVFAAAAALSGWRMRNTFFGVLSAILVIAYVAGKLDRQPPLPAMIVASVIAIAAAFALRRVWQRPSTERLFAGLALAMPVTGYLATIAQRIFNTNTPTDVPVALILGTTAIVLFACGVIWRDRVLLVSATLSTACAAIELRDLIDYPDETKLIAAGVIVVAIAAILGRALRNATRGFVVTPVSVGAYDEAMQIGGIISVAPHGTPASHQHTGPELADSASPTDKSYGGGGAGGGY